MVSREDIARRHGITDLAHKLVGDTPEALEADAAAKAALIRMFGPSRIDEAPPEPAPRPVEGLPAKDKPISDYTEEESAAQREAHDRTMREQARREERERREEQERREAEVNRTDEQRFGDAIVADAQPGAKQARNVAFLRGLGLLGDAEEEQ